MHDELIGNRSKIRTLTIAPTAEWVSCTSSARAAHQRALVVEGRELQTGGQRAAPFHYCAMEEGQDVASRAAVGAGLYINSPGERKAVSAALSCSRIGARESHHCCCCTTGHTGPSSVFVDKRSLMQTV